MPRHRRRVVEDTPVEKRLSKNERKAKADVEGRRLEASMAMLQKKNKPSPRRLLEAYLRDAPHEKDDLFKPNEPKELERVGLYKFLLQACRTFGEWDVRTLKLFNFMTGILWSRSRETLQLRGKSEGSRIDSLMQHVFETYPTPVFLRRAALEQITGRTGPGLVPHSFELYLAIARGENAGKAVERFYHVHLTRRAAHIFLQSPTVDTRPFKKGKPGRNEPSSSDHIRAMIRRAQVLAAGGDERLVAQLTSTHFFTAQNPALEPKRVLWVEWLCRQGMLDIDQIGPLTDYVYAKWREDMNYSLAGRTGVSLINAMEAWHRELNQQTLYKHKAPPTPFPKSGFEGKSWKRKDDQGYPVRWTMTEILSSNRLLDEGKALHHCVASYAPRVDGKNMSIWSLMLEDRPMVTIEVRNKAVVQVRGKYNRQPTAAEQNLVEDWKRANYLR